MNFKIIFAYNKDTEITFDYEEIANPRQSLVYQKFARTLWMGS